MTNTELTLDQLTAIAGGGVFAKLDGIKAGATADFWNASAKGSSICRGGKDNGVLVKTHCTD